MVVGAAAQHTDLELLGVLAIISALLIGAYRLRIPYPLMLVLGGAAIGFIPGLPEVELGPDLVLVIFLPPLLYAAAFFSSLRDLRDNLRQISLLSIGCVLFTMLGVAVVAHAVVPGMSWQVAFTLGAVLSPTDAVAATAIASNLGAPQQFVTVVEGESLLNDATALIAYRFASAAVVSGSFSALSAGGEFLVSAAAGAAIGVAIGWVIAHLRRGIDDAPTEITISLVTPYFAYLPAEALGVSAVLAAVTAGIWLGWRSPRLITPSTRIQAFAVWEILVFLTNAALFTLVGLQLPRVLDGVRGEYGVLQLAGYGLAVSSAVIVLRLVWVLLDTYGSPLVVRAARGGEAYTDWRVVVLVAWSGMRGAVSLAAALALPLTIDGGAPFPMRDLVIFLTYGVILSTLMLQGLSLPWLMRVLGLSEEGDTGPAREAEARLKAAEAAIARLDVLAAEDWVREDTVTRMRGGYEHRVRRMRARADPDDDGALEDRSLSFQRLRREVLEAEREEIIRLRNVGHINDVIMRRIERDLDLEDARLEI